jgi:hypothetical protein
VEKSFLLRTVGILFFIFLSLYSIYKYKRYKKGFFGTVRNIKYENKGIGNRPVITFEIYFDDGKIFYAGLDDHVYDIQEGVIIQFWPTLERICNRRVPKSKTNPDGTIERWSDTIYYYGIKRYRIFSSDVL